MCVVRACGLLDILLASEAKTDGAGEAIVGLPIAAVGGLMRFSFCRLEFKVKVTLETMLLLVIKSSKIL